MSSLRAVLLVLLPALLAGGCASSKELWAEATYRNLSYSSLYGVVLTTIDAEGYPVRMRDPQRGSVETEWVYGMSNAVVRGPARRKVFATIEPLDDGTGYLVRMRVAEEVIPKGGILNMNPRESEDWESYKDNFDIAEYLMAKVAALLSENRVSP